MSGHRTPDGLTHDKPGTRRNGNNGSRCCGVSQHEVDDQMGAGSTRASLHRRGEVARMPQSELGWQHGRDRSSAIRRTTRCGPCDAEPTGWSDQHGYAYATGNHGSWPADDCSAGRCAWSRSAPGEVHVRTGGAHEHGGCLTTGRCRAGSADSKNRGRARGSTVRSRVQPGQTACRQWSDIERLHLGRCPPAQASRHAA